MREATENATRNKIGKLIENGEMNKNTNTPRMTEERYKTGLDMNFYNKLSKS